jgi:hypothetical protein
MMQWSPVIRCRWSALRPLACRVAICLAALPMLGATSEHPLHTTITTIVYHAGVHRVTATIRVFTDDLGRAIVERTHGSVPAGSITDAVTFAYLNVAFGVVGPDGRPVPLEWCGSRTTGDLRWLCIQATVPVGLRGVRIRDAVLTDVFSDQVNIVIADYDGHHTSLLFTRGEDAKALP